MNRLRLRLLKEVNETCEYCGFNEKRPDGGCILEVDHIDGDHKNNVRSNLRVLCPNCHALTPNFRNWGRRSSTREYRRTAAKKAREQLRKQQVMWEEKFKNFVMTSADEKLIDYSKFGWVKQVADGMKIAPQKVNHLMIRLLPDFYYLKCFCKTRKRAI